LSASIRIMQRALSLLLGAALVCGLARAATVEHVFNVDIHDFRFLGKIVPSMMVNGGPGPTIHVQRGDRLIIHLTPATAVRGLSIHWHGFEMKGHQPYDGVTGVTMCPIPAGTTFVYNFTVDEVPGTYWWHTHSHSSNYQWHDMVAGALIVHEDPVPAAAAVTPMAYENERLLFFLDMFEDNPHARMLNSIGGMHQAISRGLAGDVVGTLPWWGAVLNFAESETNGTVVNVEAGETYRFRVICGNGLFGLNFSIPGLRLTIVATDGSPVPAPFEVDAVFIYPAERYDVEVTIPLEMDGTTLMIAAKTHESAAQGYDHTINGLLRVGASAPYKIHPFIELTDSPVVFNCYPGQIDRGTCNNFGSINADTAAVESSWDYSAYNTDTHELDFFFNAPPQFGHFVRVNGNTWTQHVNSHYPLIGDNYPYRPHNHTVFLDLELERTAIVILRTNARMHHPMHFHGLKFEVLEQLTVDQNVHCHITACDYADKYKDSGELNRLKNIPYTGVLKDTIVMPAGGVSVIRFPVSNPGAWIAHCHILLHLDDGMTLIVRQGSPDVHREIAMPADTPACMPEEEAFIQPACDCYFDSDQLRFTQLEDTWRCSRPHLCFHDKNFYPTPNFEPAEDYTQGIAMHELGADTSIVLPVMFSLMFLIAVTAYTYHIWKQKSADPAAAADSSSPGAKAVKPFYSTFTDEFMMEWGLRYRDAINGMRVIEVSGLAILSGVVFWQVGEDTSNRGLRESVSLLFFSVTLWTFTRMYPAIPAHFEWVMRMKKRISAPKTNHSTIVVPSLGEIMKLSLSRSLVYFCAESWWPILFGLIVYPIAHINGKADIWIQHIFFLILNNLCYISFGAVVGATAPVVAVGMIASTLYSQTSLVCAGFYRTLPAWLSWMRYMSFVYYTFSGLVKGAYHWTDSYSCRSGDGRVGQEWCLLETAGVIEDLKIRGISVANSSDPNTNDVSFEIGMLVMFYCVNVIALALVFTWKIKAHCKTLDTGILDGSTSVELSSISPMSTHKEVINFYRIFFVCYFIFLNKCYVFTC
jgi:FtsP/CotA-like multicopper oxidase with cupredoxin domain